MMKKTRLTQLIFTTLVATCVYSGLLAAANVPGAPAGQMCPGGAYVIGFDSDANIICSGACGNGVLNPGESCDDGNTESGDGCTASCQAERVEPEAHDEKVVVHAAPADAAIPASTPGPVISDVKPSKLTFGTRELTIKVSGTGFNADSVIIFAGSSYTPSVNQAGTELTVTIPTRTLSIAPYAITVSNGTGLETTRKRALEIY
jgi:cysteine-rich repeat protein